MMRVLQIYSWVRRSISVLFWWALFDTKYETMKVDLWKRSDDLFLSLRYFYDGPCAQTVTIGPRPGTWTIEVFAQMLKFIRWIEDWNMMYILQAQYPNGRESAANFS